MAIRKICLTCIVLVCVIIDTLSLTFNEVPVDTAVLLGNTAQFNCSISCTAPDICTGLTWAERVTSLAGTDVDIYYENGNKFNPNHLNIDRFSIAPGTVNLRIRNVKKTDAGRYICKANQGADDDSTKFAFITVLDILACNHSGIAVEGDKISVSTCNIKFTKSSDAANMKIPSLKLDIPGTSLTTTKGGAEITANFTVTSADNGRYVTCSVYYKKPPPHYSDMCTTSLVVHFGPKDMLIITKNNFDWTNVKPGDILTCTASANPEPSYVWWKVSGSGNDIVVLNGPILRVTTSMQGRYRFACKATNIVNKEIKTAGIDIDFIVVVATTQAAHELSTESSSQPTEQQTTSREGTPDNVPADGPTTNLVPAVVVLYVISLPSLSIIIVLLIMFIQMRKRLVEITSDKAYMTLKPIQQPPPGESEYSQIPAGKGSDPNTIDSPLPCSTVYENSEVLHKRQPGNRVLY